MARDNYTCAYCNLKFIYEELHIDHIFPKSKGGEDIPTNLVTACKRCNIKKKATILDNPPVVADIKIEEGDLVEEDYKYPIKGIRMSEETWEALKKARKKSGLTWNLFIIKLLYENKN